MSAEETRSALTIESSEPAYSFQPLGEKEIRLLTLHAGETDDPIKTILSHTSFNEDLNYEALSYVWGKSIAKEPAVTDPEVEVQLALQWITKDKPFNGRPKVEKVKWKDFPRHEHSYMYYQQGGPRLPEQITCNEVPITIGGELCSALKRLRKPDADRVLWIDALTINQADLDERANQVGLMHDIFARSKRVLIWLGENYSDVDDAPETIHKIAAKLVPFWKGAQTEENAELMALRSNAFKSDPAVWCVQEVVNAPDSEALVIMGAWEMEWKAFASIIHTLRAHDLDSLLWSRGECHGSHAVRMIMDLSINSHHDRRPTLLSLLQDTRSFKSTLPVDKIYGLLNLISDAEECDISVDYTSDAASLYTDLAINHMMRTNTLDILHDCWGGGTESSTLVLPSWIPDWTVPHWHETAISWKLTFAAAGKSEPEFSFDDSRRTMFVKGRVLDSVAGVETVRQIPRNVEPNDFQGDPDIPPWLTQPGSKPWYYRDKDGKPYWESSHEKFFEESTKSRRAWIQNAMAVAFPNKTCTPAQFQALWRTFIWDLTPSGLRPSEEYGKLFSDWLVFVTATHEEFQQHRLARKAAGVNLDLREEDTVEESERDAVASKLEFGRANARCYNRRFYRSTAGRFGWGVDGIKPGDRICVFNGAQIPFIVRPVDGAHYRIIGDTYTHGLMYGEGTTSDYAEETIQLV